MSDWQLQVHLQPEIKREGGNEGEKKEVSVKDREKEKERGTEKRKEGGEKEKREEEETKETEEVGRRG